MTTGVFFLVLLAGLGVMLYHRISLKVVSAAIFGALLLYSVVFHIPYLLWILALVILVPLTCLVFARTIWRDRFSMSSKNHADHLRHRERGS